MGGIWGIVSHFSLTFFRSPPSHWPEAAGHLRTRKPADLACDSHLLGWHGVEAEDGFEGEEDTLTQHLLLPSSSRTLYFSFIMMQFVTDL